jgi:CheY-like chemotaxis protein
MEPVQGRPKVLAIDDDALTHHFLRRELHCDLSAAMSGEEGLELISRGSFELVLLDIVMPGLDGFQVLAKLRADPRTRLLPVVVLSMLDRRENVARAFELGADDYLIKPIDPFELRSRVKAHIERHRLRNELVENQRHENLRHVVAGLDHMVNNPLFVVRGFCELLQHKAGTEEPAAAVWTAVQRIEAAVNFLSTMARRESATHETFDLNGVVEICCQLVQASLSRGELQVNLGAEPLWVVGDAFALTHAFLALLLEVTRSRPAGGRIRVTSGTADRRIFTTFEGLPAFVDDGPLAAMQRVVREHHGEILLERDPDRTISVILPAGARQAGSVESAQMIA